ncbi:tetrapyrrole methylase [Melampsora americana]|nr:tetrapyrrole methylase [Melampsora americana]
MSSRAFSCLEAGFNVTLAKFSSEFLPSNEDHLEILNRIKLGQLNTCEALPLYLNTKSCQDWLQSLSIFDDIALVCSIGNTNQTLPHQHHLAKDLMISLRRACYNLRIPLNINDHSLLSDFTFPITYRWPSIDQFDHRESTDGQVKTTLQLALSTSGCSRRLANRLKREIVSKINERAGDACEAIAELRTRTRISANQSLSINHFQLMQNPHSPFATVPFFSSPQSSAAHHLVTNADGETDEDAYGTATAQGDVNTAEPTVTRMRWISQISEYWPINKIADLHHNPQAIEEILNIHPGPRITPPSIPSHPNRGLLHEASLLKTKLNTLLYLPNQTNSNIKKGRIYLVGSGPGHASLLTCAANAVLTNLATVVLSDKLVPESIIDLIPSHVKIHIAKKFPGNSENAQYEFMDQAIRYAKRGETVVRLKQGDPFIYGRGGEEILYFRKAGYEPIVIPGISSSIAGPLLFNIPVTQRGVAESLVLCTGVGRNGKVMKFPTYERSRTLIVLMGVNRLEKVVKELLESQVGYPGHLPIAIIERASSFDQRVVAGTLSKIVQCFQKLGEQRPPGMMVIGWCVMCLDGNGQVDILDHKGEEDQDLVDKRRISDWLDGRQVIVKEGMSKEFDELQELFKNIQ